MIEQDKEVHFMVVPNPIDIGKFALLVSIEQFDSAPEAVAYARELNISVGSWKPGERPTLH